MIVRLFIIGLLCLSTPLSAQSVKLAAYEIKALLSGNTAVGKWEGARYRQYFDADGSTIYAQDGAQSTVGKWRVDDVTAQFQSKSGGDAMWEGWYVMEYAGAFYWVSKSTPPTPFNVVEGQSLSAE